MKYPYEVTLRYAGSVEADSPEEAKRKIQEQFYASDGFDLDDDEIDLTTPANPKL